MKKKPGEPVAFEKTKAGEQGMIVQIQRTQKHLGPIRSKIPLSEQIKGTMFEPEKPDEASLFDEESS